MHKSKADKVGCLLRGGTGQGDFMHVKVCLHILFLPNFYPNGHILHSPFSFSLHTKQYNLDLTSYEGIKSVLILFYDFIVFH